MFVDKVLTFTLSLWLAITSRRTT